MGVEGEGLRELEGVEVKVWVDVEVQGGRRQGRE